MKTPTYADYRGWGHTHLTAFMMTRGGWWFVGCCAVGLAIGLLLPTGGVHACI